jgi:D-alanine-D-alanine ligase
LINVAIICGGRSSEHEISCISASGVISAIDRSKYNPSLIGITKSGKWVALPTETKFEINNGQLPEVPESAPAISLDQIKADVIFPILHGPYGEDGTIQGLLEMLDVPYVGNGVLASAVAMDKHFAKQIFKAHGINVAPGVALRKGDEIKDHGLSYPLFVKPARGGSSRGTHKVKRAEDLIAAVNDAFNYDNKVMLEEAIVGREVECAVLEKDGKVQCSVPGEIQIDSKFEFYDFEAKYLDGATTVIAPAKVDRTSELQAAAVEAFISLGCSGLARVDFFYTNNNEIIINELNTMPGFTPTSVFPKLWGVSGLSYTEIISALIETALRRTNSALN